MTHDNLSISPTEQKILGQYATQIAQAQSALQQMQKAVEAICIVIMERAGGDPNTPYRLSEDFTQLIPNPQPKSSE